MSSEGSQVEVDPQVEAILRALAPEEIDMLRDAFIFMDRDSDGFVSKDEMMTKVEECVGGERFPPLLEYLGPLFIVADKDCDNRLSLTEFLMSFADGPGVVPAEVINSCVSLVRIRLTDEEISTLQENFRAIDANEDGFVDAAELEAALRQNLAEKFPDLTDANFKEIVTVVMASADADRDGKLSLSEFIRSFQEDQGVLPAAFLESRGGDAGVRELTEEETQVLREAFAVLDKNNDGYVDFVDLYNALWETLSNSVEDKNQIRDLCDLIMVTADRKKNGRLTVSEFIRGFLQNMDLMQIPVAVAQEKVRAGCAKLQQMHESGELDQLVMVFEELDSNGDGYLDWAEMVAVLTNVFQGAFPEWDDDTLATVMTAIVVGAETHDSGRLSLEEFIRSFVEGPGVIPPEVVSTWRTPTEHSIDVTEADVARAVGSVAAEEGARVDEAALYRAVCATFAEDKPKADAIHHYVLSTFTVEAPEGHRVWGRVPPAAASAAAGAAAEPLEEKDEETQPHEDEEVQEDEEPEQGEEAAQSQQPEPPAPVTVPPLPLAEIQQRTTEAQTEAAAAEGEEGTADGSPAGQTCESSSSTVVEMVSVRAPNRHPSVQAATVKLQDVSSLHLSVLSGNNTILDASAIEGDAAAGDDNDDAASSSSGDMAPRPYRDPHAPYGGIDASIDASDIHAADGEGGAVSSYIADEEVAAPLPGAVVVPNRVDPNDSATSSTRCGDVARMPMVVRTHVRQAYDSCYDALFEEELRALFRKYDTENRGYLDREWFKQVYASMEQYGLEPTKEEINSRFRRYSHDRHRVYFNEFCVLMLQRVRM